MPPPIATASSLQSGSPKPVPALAVSAPARSVESGTEAPSRGASQYRSVRPRAPAATNSHGCGARNSSTSVRTTRAGLMPAAAPATRAATASAAASRTVLSTSVSSQRPRRDATVRTLTAMAPPHSVHLSALCSTLPTTCRYRTWSIMSRAGSASSEDKTNAATPRTSERYWPQRSRSTVMGFSGTSWMARARFHASRRSDASSMTRAICSVARIASSTSSIASSARPARRCSATNASSDAAHACSGLRIS